MEAVDVLGDHALEQPAALELGQASWAALGRLSPSEWKRGR